MSRKTGSLGSAESGLSAGFPDTGSRRSCGTGITAGVPSTIKMLKSRPGCSCSIKVQFDSYRFTESVCRYAKWLRVWRKILSAPQQAVRRKSPEEKESKFSLSRMCFQYDFGFERTCKCFTHTLLRLKCGQFIA